MNITLSRFTISLYPDSLIFSLFMMRVMFAFQSIFSGIMYAFPQGEPHDKYLINNKAPALSNISFQKLEDDAEWIDKHIKGESRGTLS